MRPARFFFFSDTSPFFCSTHFDFLPFYLMTRDYFPWHVVSDVLYKLWLPVNIVLLWLQQ